MACANKQDLLMVSLALWYVLGLFRRISVLPSFQGDNSCLVIDSATRSAYMQFFAAVGYGLHTRVCGRCFVFCFFFGGGGVLVLLLGIFVFMDLMMIFYVGWQCLPIYPVIFILTYIHFF